MAQIDVLAHKSRVFSFSLTILFQLGIERFDLPEPFNNLGSLSQN